MTKFLERIRQIETAEDLTREELAMKAGMKYTRLRNLVGGQGQVRLEDIEAISKAFPEYKHWLVFGEELPEVGQVSPSTKVHTPNAVHEPQREMKPL